MMCPCVVQSLQLVFQSVFRDGRARTQCRTSVRNGAAFFFLTPVLGDGLI